MNNNGVLITLSKLKPSEYGIVQSVGGSPQIKKRLMEMGITPDTKITMRKVAPLGDPMEINIRGYELSLGRLEADQILMKKCNCDNPQHNKKRRRRWE